MINTTNLMFLCVERKVKGLNTAQISNLIKNVFKQTNNFPFLKPMAEVLDTIGLMYILGFVIHL